MNGVNENQADQDRDGVGNHCGKNIFKYRHVSNKYIKINTKEKRLTITNEYSLNYFS